MGWADLGRLIPKPSRKGSDEMSSISLFTASTESLKQAAIEAIAEGDKKAATTIHAELARRVAKRKADGHKPRPSTVKALHHVQALLKGETPKASASDLTGAERVQRYIALGREKGVAFVQNMRKNARKAETIAALDEAIAFLGSDSTKPKASKGKKSSGDPIDAMIESMRAKGIDPVDLVTKLAERL